MTTSIRARYAGYRFPAEIIGHGVWLYFRFPRGLRMVEELLAARGASSSATKPSDNGRASSARTSPIRSAVGCRARATSGIWMRS